MKELYPRTQAPAASPVATLPSDDPGIGATISLLDHPSFCLPMESCKLPSRTTPVCVPLRSLGPLLYERLALPL